MRSSTPVRIGGGSGLAWAWTIACGAPSRDNPGMLLPIERLLRRAPPGSRAAELSTLRARFRGQPGARAAGAEAVASAARLRELRVAMSQAFSDVEACRGCGRRRPEPQGHWEGGACCGSRTLDLFTQTEVASLKLAGVAPRDLRPPRDDHAGCAFRGATGCSLSPEQRPNICVRYVCLELRAELRESPRWKRISELGAAMRDEFRRFESLLDP